MYRQGLLASLFVLLFASLQAQLRPPTGSADYGFVPSSKLALASFLDVHRQELGTTSATTWQAGRVTGAKHSSLKHHRFSQQIHQLPVIGGTAVLHTRDQQVQRVTGRTYRDLNVDQNPTVAEAQAIKLSLNYANSEADHPGTAFAKTSSQLVYIDARYPEYTGALKLAYEIEVTRANPYDKRKLYVDALQANVFVDLPQVAHQTVPGSGRTTYYGVQSFDVDSVNRSQFLLRDDERDIAIYSNETEEVVSSNSSFFDGDANDPVTTMAVDVYYGTARFYDLLNESFDWRGIDGLGENMVSYVDDNNSSFVNAYWNGDFATFGGGNCHYKPLTTLDVVGHEYTHGITQRTSNLVYQGESGALNEGFSDIFGKAFELAESPGQFNWTLGNRFANSSYARSFRSMEDPTLYNNPKTYKGNLWTDGAGVHTNSGPLGHWFYLLVAGGSGQTEIGEAYSVTALPLLEALELAFSVNRDYLTESATYSDAYAAAMLVAEDMYGSSSDEYQSIANAWLAIGLPNGDGGSAGGIDVSLLSSSSSRIPRCHQPGQFEVDIVAINRGDAISRNSEVIFSIDVAGQQSSTTFDLLRDWSTGDFLFETIYFPITIPVGDYNASVSIMYPNDNTLSNNTISKQVVMGDLRVNFGVTEEHEWWNTYCDADQDATLNLEIINYSCDGLSEILQFNFLDATDNIIYTTNSQVSIGANSQRSLNFQVSSIVASQVRRVEFELSDDINTADNSATLSRGATAPLLENTIIDFEDPTSIYGFVSDDEDRSFLGTLDYQGDQVLATTGGNYTSGAPCEDVERNFTDRFWDLPTTCVDLTGVANPVLSFRMLQLHADNTQFPELNDVARAVRVIWTASNGDEAFVTIPSQPDGEWTTQEVNLPDDYQGTISLNVFQNRGSRFNFENGNDPTFAADYTFFDDIEVRTASSTVDLNTKFLVAPNPAKNSVAISVAGGSKQDLFVISNLGHVVHQATISDYTELDTSRWPAGHYTVRLQSELGEIRQTQLVVLR